MSSSSEYRIAVVDNGSGVVKCGYSQKKKNFPDHVFPSIVGRPLARSMKYNQAGTMRDVLIGDQCMNHPNLEISYPMENGIIRNWEDMDLLWQHIFGPERMNVNPAETKLMLAEPVLNSVENRAKTMQVMFEEYGFNSLYISTQAIMALYARGLKTGVCVDVGDGVAHICPVYESRILPALARRIDIAGRHVTKELCKLLFMRGYALNHSADFEIVRLIKEKNCYVAYDPKVDERLGEETTVLNQHLKLPNGKNILVAEELFRAPEILFQPRLLGQEVPGVAEALYNCIREADIDIRTPLLKNILVSGGTTLLPGFPERLEKDINDLYLKNVLDGKEEKLQKWGARVDAPPNRQHLVYDGACLWSRVMDSSNPEMWITFEQYEEEGVARCLDKLNISFSSKK